MSGARFCVVVARYSENIEWTSIFSNTIIYNKGEPLFIPNEVLLPNVGREGHTYYTHICNHYDDLADYTIFLQGNPFDHSPNLIDDLYIFQKYIDANEKFEFYILSKMIHYCNLSGCADHPNLPLIDVYEKLFNERKIEMGFIFPAGAQFAVSKEKIRKRPKEFYSKIVELLQYDVNPIEGYVIERFHTLIFNIVCMLSP